MELETGLLMKSKRENQLNQMVPPAIKLKQTAFPFRETPGRFESTEKVYF